MSDLYEITTHCRACQSPELTSLHDFGMTPLADRLVRPGTPKQSEPIAPLELALCNQCSLVQITAAVDPTVLFGGDYLYFSSVSPSLLKHFTESAQAIIQSEDINAQSFVFEIASNDGYMLKAFKPAGARILGVDPAKGPAQAAIEAGVPTVNDFFSRDLASHLVQEHGEADVILANNVLAHVYDLEGMVEGIHTMLATTGVAVIECPYIFDLVEGGEFDTIYHQHLCYFSATALDKLFERHGLTLADVERTSIHGGSLRLFVRKSASSPQRTERLLSLLDSEAQKQVFEATAYSSLFDLTENVAGELPKLIRELRASGASVAGYGAAAKATTMLAYCGLTSDDLDFIADLNPRKHGWVMPGGEFEITAPSTLLERKPDYVLILAWNFAKEIMEQQKAYSESGGRFIIPLPEPHIV